jgi:hypothetical protein
MTKRRLLRWSLLFVTLAAFTVWLEPTRVVWGWLRGEAFYQGRPTSYWRAEFDRWEKAIAYGKDATGQECRNEFWHRNRDWLEEWLDPEENRECTWPNPRNDCVGADAIPVLQELQEDELPRVRRLAHYWTMIIESANSEGVP